MPGAAAKMRAIFDTQRAAFLQRRSALFEERRADLAKLADAIRRNIDRLADAIHSGFRQPFALRNRTRRSISGAGIDPPHASAILPIGCSRSGCRSASS